VPTDLRFYLFAIPAVILLGLSKGGFTGLGALATPLIALGIDPIRGAAILLPILIVQDAVSVAAFRRSWDGHVLAVMLPGAVAGVGLGYAFAASVPEAAVMAVLGAVSILFGAYRLWVERGHEVAASASSPAWVGSLFGIATGFTSQIAHAGGPPFQMWVMPRRLPRDTFVGTTAIFFAALNWIRCRLMPRSASSAATIWRPRSPCCRWRSFRASPASGSSGACRSSVSTRSSIC
jgi:uncharacterized membrane protein YfcA